MAEGEPAGVQELPPDEGRRLAVEGVADDGMTGGGEVDADLVGAAGGRGDFDEGGAVEALTDAVDGARRTSAFDYCHALAVSRVAADGAFDDSFRLLDASLHEGEVELLDAALLQLSREVGVSAVVLGDEEEAGGVLVESMDDSRPEYAADAGKIGAVGQESVDEGMSSMAGRGMHGQARGLIDDEEVLVLVDDVKGHGFRLDVERPRRRDAHVDDVVASQEVRWADGASVNRDKRFVDEASGVGAREAGAALGNEGIETLPFVFQGDKAERLLRQVFFSRQMVSLRVRNVTIAKTPTQIDESATLKAGQWGNLMKSVTSPTRMRSVRLPMAPPS